MLHATNTILPTSAKPTEKIRTNSDRRTSRAVQGTGQATSLSVLNNRLQQATKAPANVLAAVVEVGHSNQAIICYAPAHGAHHSNDSSFSTMSLGSGRLARLLLLPLFAPLDTDVVSSTQRTSSVCQPTAGSFPYKKRNSWRSCSGLGVRLGGVKRGE